MPKQMPKDAAAAYLRLRVIYQQIRAHGDEIEALRKRAHDYELVVGLAFGDVRAIAEWHALGRKFPEWFEEVAILGEEPKRVR